MIFRNSKNSDNAGIIDALNASQAVIEFSPSGKILTANANFLDAIGYGAQEIIGQHHSMFCDPAYVSSEAYRRFWPTLAAGSFLSDEFKRFGRGGKVLWLQASYNPIKDRQGKVTKVIKFAADITAAKMQSIDFAGKVAAIDRAQAVIEFSLTGEILTANENFLKTLGYSLAEVRGQHHRMFCDPNYARSAEYQSFWEELAQGRFRAGEFRRIGKNSREVFIQASYNPIFDDTGAAIKVVKFATDMTDVVVRRKRNETLGKDINGELASVLDQMSEATRMTASAVSASTQTGSVITSVAAASEQLNQSVSDISSKMDDARNEVETVSRSAEAANISAGTLNETANAMNSIVLVIQNIASQINLLALNATIESARAGEAGKSFAVVACEVKVLATQAAESTKTIEAEISRMQAVSTEVLDALASISSAMTSVLTNVGGVNVAIGQQRAVTLEVSANMQLAVTAVREIEANLGTINTTFVNVTQSSETVKSSVEKLAA
jgi:methyl-accepting chemotaxis protein